MTSLVLLAMAGCGQAPEEGPTLLGPREQLIRASVELRGVHPSEEELEAIEASPGLYADFVDRYLEDERFLERVREIFNTRWQTRTGETYFDPEEAGLYGVDPDRVADSLGDEPLRLLTWVVENNRPFSEVVTADFTMADEAVAMMWDLDYPAGASGWQQATYRDGRPHAGVLTMNTMWMRYPSMGGNANRHRANAVSRALLCDDFLARPIVLDRAAVDQLTEDPEDAISSNPSCMSCHSTLDPLAAHFFGFYFEDDVEDLDAARTYRPEREEAWRDYSGLSPAYFGTPTRGLIELGEALADDPRFSECAAATVYEAVMQKSLEDADWEAFQGHLTDFQESALSVTALVRSVVLSDDFRAAVPSDADRISGLRKVSPAQLAGVIEGITDYRWSFGGRDGLTRNDLGLPALFGGVDGAYATQASHEPSLSVALIQERLAQAAAWDVAEHDLDTARAGEARLLKYVTVEDTPETSPEAFEHQIRYLYLAATGLPLETDATEPEALMAVWKQVYSVEGSEVAAWAAVTSAVLRDPSVLFY
jgi:hypothetical protein